MKLENIFGIPNFQLVTIRVGTVLYSVEPVLRSLPPF